MRYYKSKIDGSPTLVCNFCKTVNAFDPNVVDIEATVDLPGTTGKGVCSVCGTTDLIQSVKKTKSPNDLKAAVTISVPMSVRTAVLTAAKDLGLSLSEYVLSSIDNSDIISLLEELEPQLAGQPLHQRLLAILNKQRNRLI